MTFSLKTLLIFVALFAVACAHFNAFRTLPSPYFTQGYFDATGYHRDPPRPRPAARTSWTWYCTCLGPAVKVDADKMTAVRQQERFRDFIIVFDFIAMFLIIYVAIRLEVVDAWNRRFGSSSDP